MIGTLKGTVQNSYFAGSTDSFGGGVAGYNDTGYKISHVLWTSGMSAVGMGSTGGTSEDSSKKVTADQIKSSLSVLNTDIVVTGYYWVFPQDGSNNGLPVLQEGTPTVGEVNWDDLNTAIDSASKLKKEDYTESTWSTVETALSEVNALKDKESVTQSEINAAATKLTEAIAALKKPNPSSAVALPEDESKITYISNLDDFNKYIGSNSASTKDCYFVLKSDITIDSDYVCLGNTQGFDGILDGQGHTITFDNASAIFKHVTATGVVQNIGFKGTMKSNYQEEGPLGRYMRGSVINCWSDISGSSACGFAGVLSDGGIISNCFAYGESTKGGIVNAYKGGTLINTHWQDTLSAPDYPDGALNNSGALSEENLKSMDFINALNDNRGTNGTKWGQSSTGYAYFGENQTYTPGNDWPELPGENTCAIAFQAYNEEQALTLEDARLQVSPDFVNAFKVAGTFSLPGYEVPEGSQIVWSVTDQKPEGTTAINVESGEFYVYNNGKAVVNATLQNADGSTERLASVAAISRSSRMTDIKLYIGNTEVTNGDYTVQGSEEKSIKVKAHYEGDPDTEYRDTAYSSFTYEATNSAYIYNEKTHSSFYFKKPGTASIIVKSRNDASIQATVELTSAYVAVKSIKPALKGTQVVHGRNANSDGQETDGRVAFNPIPGGVIIAPANASYADHWTMTSSDETIGYYSDGAKVYVPKQMGTVTYTATLEDTDPTTGITETITGSSEVTYTYLNPITSVSLDKKEFTVKAQENEDFSLDVTGEKSAEGYSVTDPSMIWSYSQKGIATITKTKSGAWKRVDGAPDTNNYFLCSDYRINGISEGTVEITGTPVDQTNHPEPIKFTVTVTKGDAPDTDNQALARKGAEISIAWIKEKYADGFKYGNEWDVFTLLRHGETISEEQLDSYYQSVVKEIKTWDAERKPTDLARVSLALTMMGKDITDIEGINLAEWMYDSDSLTDGSNELLWVMLALDAADITIPDNAKWSRASMIKALLAFQNPTKGFFGLTNNKTASLDLTAMALQPLARYQTQYPEVAEAVAKAVEWLKTAVGDDYGYGTSEGTAQVVIALSALGIDPTMAEAGFGSTNMNMITNLMQYQGSGGGFIHQIGMDITYEISTIQVLEAFDSYLMSTKDGAAYWDVKGTSGIIHTVHAWDAGVITRQPNCTEKGIKTFTCTVCHATRTEEIAATGHKWGEWTTVSRATVFTKETQKRSCTVCGITETRETGNTLTPTMKVSANSFPLKVKQSISNFKVTGMAAGDSVKSWKSSNTKIVKVTGKANGTCKITAQKKTGTAKITITLKSGLKKTIKVKVQKSAVKTTKITGFKGGKKSVTLKKGQKFTLVPICSPISTRQKAAFTSSNKKVAKVDSKGRIKALKPGKAKITVKVGKKKATFTVTVKK